MDAPIYLDHNSTAPVHPEVVEVMMRCSREGFANPASQHFAGRRARKALEEAREGIATILGADTSGMTADRLIFTSGGTEANNLALASLVRGGATTRAYSVQRIIVSAIEHPSVTAAAEALAKRGYDVQRLGVDPSGVVQPDTLPDLLTDQTRLVSVMVANNETGVLQPIAEIASLCEQRGIAMHTDAVQAVGKIPVSFRDLGVTAMTVAPHKFHGPLGIGALLMRHEAQLEPLLFGGFQQAGLRPGTESVGLAVGFHAALQLWQRESREREQRMASLRDRLEANLRAGAADVVVIGEHSPRLPQTSNVAFPGINRQALVMALDMAGVACSTGSACASGSSEPSPVLLAMGLDRAVVDGSIRLSLGALTTAAEIDLASQRILKCVNSLRQRQSREKSPSPPRQAAPNAL